MKILIVGSENMTPLMNHQVWNIITTCVRKEDDILVSDNPYGVDQEVVEICNRLSYPRITVFGIGHKPRNGGTDFGLYRRVKPDKNTGYYKKQDYLYQYMVDRAEYGFFLRNHQEGIVDRIYDYMANIRNKPALLVKPKELNFD